MCLPSALERIKYYVPHVKLIAILRQPAERLFSRYAHLLRVGKVPGDFFEGIFDKNSVWWQRPDLVQEGFYYKQLERFFSNFQHENIKIFF